MLFLGQYSYNILEPVAKENLLVVYRESVNLIGYITRRLSAVSKIQLVVYHQYCVLIGWATSRLYVIAQE